MINRHGRCKHIMAIRRIVKRLTAKDVMIYRPKKRAVAWIRACRVSEPDKRTSHIDLALASDDDSWENLDTDQDVVESTSFIGGTHMMIR